jgi:hypothetical protein
MCADKKVKTLAKHKVKVADHLADNNRELLCWSLAQVGALTRDAHCNVPPRPSQKCKTQQCPQMWTKPGSHQVLSLK